MLMYRQIDKNRNAVAMTVDKFPPHIQKLLQQMREKEESDRLAKEKENDMFRLKIFCHHPTQKQLLEVKLLMFYESLLAEAKSDAYEKFQLKDLVSLDDCRLVSYNKLQDCIDCSFEGDDLRFCDVSSSINIPHNDWLLEIRLPGMTNDLLQKSFYNSNVSGTEFLTYKSGGVNMKVYLIDLESEEVEGPSVIRVNAGETIKEFKIHLASMFNLDVNTIKVILFHHFVFYISIFFSIGCSRDLQ